MDDRDFIKRTLELAAQGKGLVSPNPLVGSIVVSDGEIVGRGYHRYDQIKHAEVWALEEADELARGATVYVNLEPCSHSGAGKRTPPCSQALIDAGVKRVVASMVDPYPQVNGRGFDQLRAAGVEVTVGTMEPEARRLNEKFIKYVTTGWPFVHLKVACSLDGRIATRTGDSKWITGEQAREASQMIRHEYDAILVGVETVLADDPALTDRTGLLRRKPLMRVVLDSSLRTPPKSKLVEMAKEGSLMIFTAPDRMNGSRRQNLEAAGALVTAVESSGGYLSLVEVLQELALRQVTGLIVEGGATVAASFVEQRLIDKATFFIAPRIIGGKDAVAAIGGAGAERLEQALDLKEIEIIRRGEDFEFTGYPQESK